MASFKDYTAAKTATLELFHGESMEIRQLTSQEFLITGLPFNRERTELAAAGKLDEQAETRIRLGYAFALVESWTFDEPLTFENFLEFMQSPDIKEIAGDIARQIDNTAARPESVVKKKSPTLLAGSVESGNSTESPETKTDKPAAKR